MKCVVRTVLSLAMVVVIVSPLLAAEGKKGKKTPAKPQDPAKTILDRLEKAELTKDQVAKIRELAVETAEKTKALQAKAALTPEQRKARQEAQAKAKAEGKTGKEVQEAVLTAMELTDEQKAAVKEEMELRAELQKQAFGLLTAEQREKAGLKQPKKKARN